MINLNHIKRTKPVHVTSINPMVLVGGPSAISFNTFYQLLPRGFSRLEGSIPVQLQIAYDKTSDSVKDFMTVQKAQVFPFHNSTCQHTTNHQCLLWPHCLLWPVQGHQEGTGVQSGSKTWTQIKQKTFPTDDSQPFLSRKRSLHFEKGGRTHSPFSSFALAPEGIAYGKRVCSNI